MRWWWYIRGRIALARGNRLSWKAVQLGFRASALATRAEEFFRRARGEGDDA